MELDEAKRIVTALANGIDPITGEVLPAISPYNHPQVIRALFVMLSPPKVEKQPKKTLEEKQQKNVAAGRAKNAGLPWTDESKAELAEKFTGGVSLDELARHFERTRGAIVSELTKQGLIERESTSDAG